MTNCIETRRDSFGRSSGYTYAKDGSVQQAVTTGYGTDGRISSAGFLHGGQENKRGNTLVASRAYQYDSLGRPTSRTLARQGATRNDVFTYNDRSKSPRRLVGGLDTPSQKKSASKLAERQKNTYQTKMMSYIEFHIKNGVRFRPPEVVTLNHRLANANQNR